MPLVPEKLNSRQEVRNAIASQFWDQPAHSVRSLDGMARTLACEPPPVGQTAASGLLRPQQLLITQAAGLPVLPGFSRHDGGVVLDRVIAKVGGKEWWANLSGRAKAQQMWAAHRGGAKVGDALKNLNSYALNARTRFALGRNGTLNWVLEAPNAHDLCDTIKNKAAKGTKKRHAGRSKPALKSQAWAKYQLPGHDLIGSTAWNQEYLDSAANYSTVPMALSLDLASKDRPDGIQYRVGLHQVSAPEVEGSQMCGPEKATSSSAACFRSSLHVQGAVAVEGEGHLWRPSRRTSAAAAQDAPASVSVQPAQTTQSATMDESPASSQDSRAAGSPEQAQPSIPNPGQAAVRSSAVNLEAASGTATPGQPQPSAMPATPAASKAHSAATTQPDRCLWPQAQSKEAPSHATKQPADAQQAADMSSTELSRSAAAQTSTSSPLTNATATVPSSSSAAVSSIAALSQDSGAHAPTNAERGRADASSSQTQASTSAPDKAAGTAQARRAWPLVRRRRADGSSGVLIDNYSSVVSDSDTSEDEQPQQPGSLLGGINAKQIQSGIRDAQANVVKLRQVLDAVTSGVQEGRAQQQHQRQLALSRKLRPVPYSPWLSQPFLKVNAAVGCLARMPLPHHAFRPTHHTSQPAAASSQPQQPLDRPSSRFASELWAPYLRDTALRVFGSVGVTGQLGHFCRPVLDFTAGSVRLDFGLTSPHHVNTAAAASSYGNLSVFNPREDHLDAADPDEAKSSHTLASTHFKNRAFALEGRGIWHALSASITQQVIGPVRARADFRYALDLPSSIPQGPDGKRSWHNILEAAGKTRPTLLETVYGLEIIIPGTSGIARGAVWYSPMRKEAMAEIKLF